MKWENSKALTPLKYAFLKAFFLRESAFFLTGGSALGIFYLQHRMSFDLDFFTANKHVEWHRLDNEIRAIASEIGAECRSITASPTFRRYELRQNRDREILDFVIDMTPQIDKQKEQFGNITVDTLHEIAINKICTLISRCDLKDLVDLFFLNKRGLTVPDLFEEARQKEGGLDPAMLSFILARMEIDQIPEYMLEPMSLAELTAFVRDLKLALADKAYPEDSSGTAAPSGHS